MVEVNELKSLKKDMLQFKKCASKDITKALIKLEEIQIKINIFLKDKQVLSNEKLKTELIKMQEILILYKKNSKDIVEFKKKWG